MHCHVLSFIVTMSVVPHWCRQHVAYILRESRALLHLSAALWCQDPPAFCLPVLCWQETPETSHDNAMIVSTYIHIIPHLSIISLSRPAFAHIFHYLPFCAICSRWRQLCVWPTAQPSNHELPRPDQGKKWVSRRLSEHGQTMFFWIELLPATFLFVEDVDIRIYNCANHCNAVGHLQSTSFFC